MESYPRLLSACVLSAVTVGGVRVAWQMFAVAPCEGDVPPGESITVKAVFSPDYTRIWPFLGAFRVEAKDQVRRPLLE